MCGYCSRSANIQGWQELPIMWLLFESGVHSVYTIIGVGDTSTSTHTVYMCTAMCLHVCMFVCLHLCVCVSVYSRQGCLTSQLYAYIHVHNRAIVIKDYRGLHVLGYNVAHVCVHTRTECEYRRDASLSECTRKSQVYVRTLLKPEEWTQTAFFQQVHSWRTAAWILIQ